MSCRLLKDIKHNCEYNGIGISSIYLLDIRDFIAYQFLNDRLFDQCFVEAIKIKASNYISLDVVDESNFLETQENGIYKQQLTTFVRSLDAEKTASLLLASNNKYITIYRTPNKSYCFGSDGGASVLFTQQTGQKGEVSGYSITIDKSSIYPLFEIDIDNTQHITRIFNGMFNEKFN